MNTCTKRRNSRVKTTLGSKHIILILLFTLFILFRVQIWEYYNTVVVDLVLNKITAHWLVDIMLILLSVTIVYYTVHYLCRNTRITNSAFFFSLFAFLLYFYCRVFSESYMFEPFYWEFKLKYADIIYLIFVCLLAIKIQNWLNTFKKPYYFNSPFSIDYPILSATDDIYKRTEFAKLLSQKIQSELENTKAGALSIGINGSWGAGKTSFTNLVAEQIRYENRLIIEFNPWRSPSPAKLTEDFFELLVSKLKEHDPRLSRNINSYASTLTNIHENTITRAIKSVSEYISPSPNKSETYEIINKAITTLKKQVIIIIDDLDRLDKKEIIEVLRLIRNTANFNGLVYLVSYDKEYVLEAVKEFNPYNYREFLEKIFQFEFILPSVEPVTLRNELKNILRKHLTIHSSLINSAVDYAGPSGKNITARVIKNKRDVLRFSNAILFEINGIEEELNFIDFFLIHLLKLKFTAVYKFIAGHFELLFISENRKIRLRTIEEKGVNENYIPFLGTQEQPTDQIRAREQINEANEKRTIFEEYLERNSSDGYSNMEKEIILEILNELMKEKEYRLSSTSKDFKSFVYSKNFDTYLNIRLTETSFTAKEFEMYRHDDYKRYKEIIFKWITNGKISEVQERLNKIVDFSTKEEWENHWKILIDIAKHQHLEGGVYGINYREIIDVLNYPRIPNGTGYHFFENADDYTNYVWQIFEDAPDPYIIEGSILVAALSPYASLPFADNQIEDQLLKYFKKYCRDHKEITNEFRELYQNAVKKTATYGREFSYQEEAEYLFKQHFLKYLTGQQLSGFIIQATPGNSTFILNTPWLKTFFGPPLWNSFEKYLDKADNIKQEKQYYDEFKEFYFKLKANNYNEVEFAFLNLKPSLWNK